MLSGGGRNSRKVDFNHVKCVVVGDGAVGKTCLLVVYSTNTFPKEYIPTVFDNYEKPVEFNHKTYFMSLWDTAGQEDYDHLRKLSFPGTNVFVLCFSLMNPDSLDNVKSKWLPSLMEHEEGEHQQDHGFKNVPVAYKPKILVGMKLDLRSDPEKIEELKKHDLKPITTEEGGKLAQEWGLDGYIECSALKRTNIEEVFQKVIEVHENYSNGVGRWRVEQGRMNGKKNCCIIL